MITSTSYPALPCVVCPTTFNSRSIAECRVKTTGNEDRIQVVDLIQLVDRARSGTVPALEAV